MRDAVSIIDVIHAQTERILPRITRIRRQIHAQPDLSGHEQPTAKRVYKALDQSDLSVRYLLHNTAVVATLSNGHGKTVALRADMDALPITEQTGLPYRSKTPGTMHACGHDIHTAALVGAMQVLAAIKNHWQGTIVALFQPHEEKEPGGARRMIEAGALPRTTDAIFGLHVAPELETGQVGIKEGFACAAVFDFDITITGRGGHGASPQRCIDPIVCTSALIGHLQTLISRECPPLQPAVLSIGSFHSGNARNVIPDHATITGTVRTFSDELSQILAKRIVQMADTTARSFGASALTVIIPSYPAGYNDPVLTQAGRQSLSGMLGKKSVIMRNEPVMFAEDFAFFQKQAPGLLVHLGVRPRGQKTMSSLHSPTFLPDESSIKTGILAHCALALGGLDIKLKM